MHTFYRVGFYIAFVTAVMCCASFFAPRLGALPSYLRPWISLGLGIGLCFLTVHLFRKWKAAERQRQQRLAQLRRGGDPFGPSGDLVPALRGRGSSEHLVLFRPVLHDRIIQGLFP